MSQAKLEFASEESPPTGPSLQKLRTTTATDSVIIPPQSSSGLPTPASTLPSSSTSINTGSDLSSSQLNGAQSYSESTPPTPVKETHRISIDINPVSGRKQLNKYEVYRELGRGQHGKVKLGRDTDNGEFVAIKTVDRKDRPRLGRPRGSSAEVKIRREIAILKKCQHPNIVRLIEVLDDVSCRKIYLILEYLEKGEIKWQNADGSPALTREAAKQAARDTLLGLEYLHSVNIIHRDIKPANLLLSKDDILKISDFGVSYAYTGDDGDELEMSKTVGTPAFFAPELCIFEDIDGKRRQPITSKIDIWAYGVTLYCFLYGHIPFDANNEYELFRVIAKEDVHLPDPGDDEDLAQANDLLRHLMDRDPDRRWGINQIKQHPWIANDLPNSQRQEFLSTDMSSRHQVDVSNQELDDAVRGIATRLKLGFSRLAYRIRSSSNSSVSSSTSSSTASANSSSRSLFSRNTSFNKTQSVAANARKEAASTIETATVTREMHVSIPGTAKILSPDDSGSSSVVSSASSDEQITTFDTPTSPTSPHSGIKPKSKSMSQATLPVMDKWSRSPSTEPPARPKTFYALDPLDAADDSNVRQVDLLGHSSSSDDDDYDDDDDNGELTLVLGRGKSRIA